jgi:hypothetical protein
MGNISTVNNTYDIGTNSNRFKSIYSNSLYGECKTSSQPSITSLGTLTGLSVSGTTEISISTSNNLKLSGSIYINSTVLTADANELNYNDITAKGTAEANKSLVLDNNKDITSIRNLTATNLYGSIGTASQSNITSLGTLTGLSVNSISDLSIVTTQKIGLSGSEIDITGHVYPSVNNSYNLGSSSYNFNNGYITNIYGSICTASQSNITSLGTLTGLSVNSLSYLTLTGTYIDVSNSFLKIGTCATSPQTGFLKYASSVLQIYNGSTWDNIQIGTTNHSSLSNLNADDHTQYLKLSGRTDNTESIGAVIKDLVIYIQELNY